VGAGPAGPELERPTTRFEGLAVFFIFSIETTVFSFTVPVLQRGVDVGLSDSGGIGAVDLVDQLRVDVAEHFRDVCVRNAVATRAWEAWGSPFFEVQLGYP